MNAWRKHLIQAHSAPDVELPHLHFCADRSADFVKALGLSFDASGLLGNHRARRFVLVVENGVVTSVKVEENPPDLLLTMASSVLENL